MQCQLKGGPPVEKRSTGFWQSLTDGRMKDFCWQFSLETRVLMPWRTADPADR